MDAQIRIHFFRPIEEVVHSWNGGIDRAQKTNALVQLPQIGGEIIVVTRGTGLYIVRQLAISCELHING